MVSSKLYDWRVELSQFETESTLIQEVKICFWRWQVIQSYCGFLRLFLAMYRLHSIHVQLSIWWHNSLGKVPINMKKLVNHKTIIIAFGTHGSFKEISDAPRSIKENLCPNSVKDSDWWLKPQTLSVESISGEHYGMQKLGKFVNYRTKILF